MYPWLWIWSPTIHMPLSGAVDEDITSKITMPSFFNGIDSQAGNGNIERQAFEVASYGRQLGLITEVLLASAQKVGPLPDDAQNALQRLKEIQASIEEIKTRQAAADNEQLEPIEQQLQDMMQNNPAEFSRLKPRLLAVLNSSQQEQQGQQVLLT